MTEPNQHDSELDRLLRTAPAAIGSGVRSGVRGVVLFLGSGVAYGALIGKIEQQFYEIPYIALTDAEKNFFANYWYETMALTRGPALSWLAEHRIEVNDIYPFTTLFQKEIDLASEPTKPDQCVIPWSSAEAFRARSEELRPLMDQPSKETETPS
jgi:hypothetical protein